MKFDTIESQARQLSEPQSLNYDYSRPRYPRQNCLIKGLANLNFKFWYKKNDFELCQNCISLLLERNKFGETDVVFLDFKVFAQNLLTAISFRAKEWKIFVKKLLSSGCQSDFKSRNLVAS